MTRTNTHSHKRDVYLKVSFKLCPQSCMLLFDLYESPKASAKLNIIT